jgi:L1 cell adhesion molecule like protein
LTTARRSSAGTASTYRTPTSLRRTGGATLAAAILSREDDDNDEKVQVHDVTALSLGLATTGGGTTTSLLTPRNTAIPTNKEHIFTTCSNYQPRTPIHVRG